MENKLWIQVETTKSTDETWTFKGLIEQSVFDAITSNKVSSGYFKLERVYWISSFYDEHGNRKGDRLYEYGGEGRLKAFKGDLHLKVDDLVSLAPIDAEVDKARVKVANKEHLAAVVEL